MRTELILRFEFEASHSLSGFEVPHPHLWTLEAVVGGEPIEGRIVDIVYLRSRIEKLIEPLKKTFLNENSYTSPSVRQFPTCETLSQFFFGELDQVIKNELQAQNRSVHLISITVAICDMNREEMGAVRLFS